eukprot:3667644-Rhodomonas_salina.6
MRLSGSGYAGPAARARARPDALARPSRSHGGSFKLVTVLQSSLRHSVAVTCPCGNGHRDTECCASPGCDPFRRRREAPSKQRRPGAAMECSDIMIDAERCCTRCCVDFTQIGPSCTAVAHPSQRTRHPLCNERRRHLCL